MTGDGQGRAGITSNRVSPRSCQRSGGAAKEEHAVIKIPIKFADFKASTGIKGKPSGRGANMALIDTAFEQYEGGFANNVFDADGALTLALYEACKNWLQLKQAKPTVTGKGIFKSTNTNLIRRRKEISEVAKHCVNALRNANKVDSRKASFDSRKITQLAKGKDKVQATPLSGDYVTERKTWLGSGKTVSIAGHFHASQGDLKNLALDQANFNGMDQNEYSAFLQKKSQHVVYFKKNTRVTCLMDFGDFGLTLRPGTKDLMDCELPAFNAQDYNTFIGKLWMYAMDEYGNLFSLPNPEFDTLKAMAGMLGQNSAKVTNFNHSTFNAGKDVICAGLIGISHGYINWIDNNSGHYKPTRASLKDAVEFMADEGRNLSQLRIGAYHYANGNITSIEVHTPQHFLSNVDAKGDVATL